MELVSPYRS
jgi:hypothetical protein